MLEGGPALEPEPLVRSDRRVVYALPYLGLGGTEYHVLHLVRAAAWETPPAVVAPDGAMRSAFEAAKARVHLYTSLTGQWWAGARSFGHALDDALEPGEPSPKSGRPPVIHVHGGAELLWLAVRHARRRRLPAGFLFTSHGYAGPGARSSYRVAGWILRRLGVPTVAVSREEARRLQRAGVPERLLHVVPNGVPDPLAPGAPGETEVAASGVLGMGSRGRIVLFVGRVVEEKGVRVLFQAFEQVAAAVPDARLVIAGDGPLVPELRAEATRSPVLRSRVECLGPVPGAARLMAHADVVCVPSLDEALGLVAVEALAAGRAVVASAAGGLSEVIEDGVSGVLVAPGDVPSLAAALRRVLGDSALQQRLGRAARRRYEATFTVEKMAATTMALYAACEVRWVGGPPGRRAPP